MQQLLHARSGISLIEIIVALSLASLLGATATGAFVTQSRFFDAQEKVGSARGVSRGAMNMIVSELRMLEQQGGVVAASAKQITVRAPYALGVVCGNTTHLTISRLPADPMVLQTADYSGLAFRTRATGTYTYVVGNSTKPNGKKNAASICTAAGVAVYTDAGGNSDGEVMQGRLPDPVPDVGAPIFLYQHVTYEFKKSVALPGRIALWRRTDSADNDEEIIAPFDTAAGFRFYVNDSPAATDVVPASLPSITGIELKLDGLGERAGIGGRSHRVPLTTSVFFKNRMSS